LGNCESVIDYRIDINNTLGTGYNYLFKLELNGNLNYSATITSLNNQSCFLLVSRKMYNSSYENATFSFQSFSGGGIPVTIRAETHTFCDSNDTYVTMDTGRMDNSLTGAGGYRRPGPGDLNDYQPAFPQLNVSYSSCNGAMPASGSYSIFSGGVQNVTQHIFPFFSGNGSVEFYSEKPSFSTSDIVETCYYYNTNTGINTLLLTYSHVSAANFNTSLSLEPLANYLLNCEWAISSGGSNTNRDFPPLNFTLIINDITPDYSCAFTACSNGSRQYVCTDLKGNYPDIITDISCLGVNQTINLGFEDRRPVTEQACVKANWFICNDVINNISAGLPDAPEWSVFPFNVSGTGLNHYFATMVSGGSRGSFSFRMWSIPPSPPVQPTLLNSTSIVCDNVSVGSIPDTFIPGLNATFFTARNFTFPSDTMHILFDVKRCSEPVVQYDGWCGKSCYSYLGNCSIAPKGDYFVSVYEIGRAHV